MAHIMVLATTPHIQAPHQTPYRAPSSPTTPNSEVHASRSVEIRHESARLSIAAVITVGPLLEVRSIRYVCLTSTSSSALLLLGRLGQEIGDLVNVQARLSLRPQGTSTGDDDMDIRSMTTVETNVDNNGEDEETELDEDEEEVHQPELDEVLDIITSTVSSTMVALATKYHHSFKTAGPTVQTTETTSRRKVVAVRMSEHSVIGIVTVVLG
ncbi:hypothetical protein CONLIGDRAFT_686820 [Coniochaeta ligniaria NRRL 30616]|uniref:Uncharacterized protein n=1 Tax=Coniochaeta ligniaria NRRL 30616 TaxID=1408157 RepID=A0A1J7I7A1_9PEZI|nr:hypothetical protein CONLIGDRAFT_686820 [Coniochaeta ligniaria NRRL 30616]